MRLDESDLKQIWDMLAAAREGVEFTAGMTEDRYLQSLVVRRAMERTIEIVGEAARKVSESGKTALPEVEWSAIIATRHIIAHQYGDVDHRKLWRIAVIHLPKLTSQLARVLADHPPAPEAQQNPAEP